MFLCFNFGNPNFFELVAYTGYKFVVLCLVMLAQVLGGAEYGTMVSYGTMVVFGLMYCVFFFMTLRRYQTAHTLAEHAQSHSLNKKTFQIGNCGVQFALIWLLSYN